MPRVGLTAGAIVTAATVDGYVLVTAGPERIDPPRSMSRPALRFESRRSPAVEEMSELISIAYDPLTDWAGKLAENTVRNGRDRGRRNRPGGARQANDVGEGKRRRVHVPVEGQVNRRGRGVEDEIVRGRRLARNRRGDNARAGDDERLARATDGGLERIGDRPPVDREDVRGVAGVCAGGAVWVLVEEVARCPADLTDAVGDVRPDRVRVRARFRLGRGEVDGEGRPGRPHGRDRRERDDGPRVGDGGRRRAEYDRHVRGRKRRGFDGAVEIDLDAGQRPGRDGAHVLGDDGDRRDLDGPDDDARVGQVAVAGLCTPADQTDVNFPGPEAARPIRVP